jgi:methyltransferase-like protein/2-polyprenyl-3-methyl-5-hydroxy-6-metoxy-1,4-benzoquinol methylase
MAEEDGLTPYDQVPYPAGAYPQSHPDRLASLGILFGMSPRDISRCRVLELGCADGSNLIPMAVALPKSTFLGIDLSARQIKPGQELIASLGLTNILLRHVGISDVDQSFSTFDYIIAHGVYSWVPVQVQEKILSICNQQLGDEGIAYVSYNTYPGWRMRGMLRDMMLYHSRKFDDPQKQIEQARALINWLAETISAENDPYGLLLKRELDQMQRWQDTYFRHDSLGEINEPLYFYQFMERAEQQGLQYLAEAEFQTMLASNYAAPVDGTLNRLGRNILEMEQYMDFLRNRMFRQTLLCHKEVKLNRSLGPWSLAGFHCASCVRPQVASLDLHSDKVEKLQGPKDLTISVSQPIVKAALVLLAESWPQTIAFSDLATGARSLFMSVASATPSAVDVETDARVLGGALLTCYTKGLCEFHVHPGQFVVSPGERPQACPLVRIQAAHRDSVTNRRHERVLLDSLARRVLPLLDGSRDRTALLEALVVLVANNSLTVEKDGKTVHEPQQLTSIMAIELDKALERYGRQALLVGG